MLVELQNAALPSWLAVLLAAGSIYRQPTPGPLPGSALLADESVAAGQAEAAVLACRTSRGWAAEDCDGPVSGPAEQLVGNWEVFVAACVGSSSSLLSSLLSFLVGICCRRAHDDDTLQPQVRVRARRGPLGVLRDA